MTDPESRLWIAPIALLLAIGAALSMRWLFDWPADCTMATDCDFDTEIGA